MYTSRRAARLVIMQLVASVLVLGSLLVPVEAYSTGPPLSTCLPMFPLHQVEMQVPPAPFTLTLSAATYSPGQSLTVKVQTNQGLNRQFKGFQVSVHRVASSNNQEEFIGTFTTNDSSSQVYDCLKAPRSMVTHKNAALRTMVSMVWTAPDQNAGDLQFLLTVVENKTTFWSKIPFSLQASPGQPVVPPTTIVPKVMVSSANAPDWSTCYNSKGCWLVPGNCTMKRGDCLAALSYRQQGADMFAFEIAYRERGQYFGLGFSEDMFMGDDLAILCTALANQESVQMGYNYGFPGPYKYFMRQYTKGLSDLVVGQSGNYTFCKFTASLSMSVLNGTLSRNYDLRQKYILFLAWGRVFQGTNNIYGHMGKPAISGKHVDLKDYKAFASSGSAGRLIGYSVLLVCTMWAVLLL